jgi:hypothetical protein
LASAFHFGAEVSAPVTPSRTPPSLRTLADQPCLELGQGAHLRQDELAHRAAHVGGSANKTSTPLSISLSKKITLRDGRSSLTTTSWTIGGRSAAFLIPSSWMDSEQKHAGTLTIFPMNAPNFSSMIGCRLCGSWDWSWRTVFRTPAPSGYAGNADTAGDMASFQ